MLDRLPWHALHTEHARFAISTPAACRYPADVAPFGATADNGPEAVSQFASLLTPGETIYLMGGAPAMVPGLIMAEVLSCLQMILPDHETPASSTDEPNVSLVPLTAGDASAMVELTNIAFPGFFRVRTCEMGDYYGIREGGELIAMAGERMALPGYREISGVCTHPAHRGKGYAVQLIRHLVKEHAGAGLRSFLHVSSANTPAIAIYKRLGFVVRREVLLYPVSRL